MALYKGRKPPRLRCRLRVGDVVKFNSRLRPDLLPANCGQYGVVVSTGNMCGIEVSFYDFPDEPIYLCENEVVCTTNAPAPVRKVDKKKWMEWANRSEVSDKEDLPDFDTLDEERARGNNRRNRSKVQT